MTQGPLLHPRVPDPDCHIKAGNTQAADIVVRELGGRALRCSRSLTKAEQARKVRPVPPSPGVGRPAGTHLGQ